MNRVKQYYADKDLIWAYFIPKERCSCGANVFHYEYDGKNIYGVCNACDQDLYIVKKEYVNKHLSEGIWK